MALILPAKTRLLQQFCKTLELQENVLVALRHTLEDKEQAERSSAKFLHLSTPTRRTTPDARLARRVRYPRPQSC